MATPKFFLKSRVYCILWINLPEKNLFKINLLTSENLYISFFLDIINFLLNFHSISKPFLLHSSQTVICQFSNLLSMRIIGIWNFWNKILKLKFIYSEKATKFDKLFWKISKLMHEGACICALPKNNIPSGSWWSIFIMSSASFSLINLSLGILIPYFFQNLRILAILVSPIIKNVCKGSLISKGVFTFGPILKKMWHLTTLNSFPWLKS